MSEGELRDLLVEDLGRQEKAHAETNAKLADVLDTLKHMANVQLALRVGQEQLTQRVEMLADHIDRVADRVDRLSTAVTRGFTLRDDQFTNLIERIERIERRPG